MKHEQPGEPLRPRDIRSEQQGVDVPLTPEYVLLDSPRESDQAHGVSDRTDWEEIEAQASAGQGASAAESQGSAGTVGDLRPDVSDELEAQLPPPVAPEEPPPETLSEEQLAGFEPSLNRGAVVDTQDVDAAGVATEPEPQVDSDAAAPPVGSPFVGGLTGYGPGLQMPGGAEGAIRQRLSAAALRELPVVSLVSDRSPARVMPLVLSMSVAVSGVGLAAWLLAMFRAPVLAGVVMVTGFAVAALLWVWKRR